MLRPRRLDQKPTQEEITRTDNLLKEEKSVSGFGIPQKVEPAPKPPKPENLPPQVKKFLDSTDKTIPK